MRKILCQDQVEAASVEAAQEEAEASAEAVAEAEALAEVITDIITIIITDPSFTADGARDTTEAVVSAGF